MNVVPLKQTPETDLVPLKVEEHALREAPPTMCQPPFLCGLFGERGAGKTTAMMQMLRWYDHYKAFDHITIYSPTYEKDPKWEALLDHGKLNAKIEMVQKFTYEHFENRLREMDSALNDYTEWLQALKAWKKFKKHHFKEDALTEEELLRLWTYDFQDPAESLAAQDRYKNGRPSFLMVFDDHSGNKDIYRQDCRGPVGMFVLRHRHYSCSIMFLSQSYRNGVPTNMRINLSMLIMFSCKSDKIRFMISEEMCSFVTPEQFVDMWKYATEGEEHGFFLVQYDMKKPEWRFRKNFHELIIPTQQNGEDSRQVKYKDEDFASSSDADD